MIPLRLSLLGTVLALLAGCNPKDAPSAPTAGPGAAPSTAPTRTPNTAPTTAPNPAPGADPTAAAESLAEARKGFKTKIAKQFRTGEPVEDPPAGAFRKVLYDAPVGKCAAYVTPDPKDGKKHPAIIWITGGDCNSIDSVWKPAPRTNDQTAHQYRDAGIVMMFPSLRGGNTNPGVQESFYGEVDDVLAAAAHLAKQEYVDPKRIYLGGHSTGGTLVLLVAEMPNPFRAVFSFGPAETVSGYPPQFRPAVNIKDEREVKLRSPGFWLDSIPNPTFVFEGTQQGNLDSLQLMAKSATNPKVQFFPVRGATHFSILAPVNERIAKKILADTGEVTNLNFTEEELNKLFGR